MDGRIVVCEIEFNEFRTDLRLLGRVRGPYDLF